jgi:hypothetical protein
MPSKRPFRLALQHQTPIHGKYKYHSALPTKSNGVTHYMTFDGNPSRIGVIFKGTANRHEAQASKDVPPEVIEALLEKLGAHVDPTREIKFGENTRTVPVALGVLDPYDLEYLAGHVTPKKPVSKKKKPTGKF